MVLPCPPRAAVAAALLAAFALRAHAQEYPRWAYVPVGVDSSFTGKDMGAIRVSLCALDWAAYRGDPSLTPMSKDLQRFSGCTARTMIVMSFAELEQEFVARGCADAVEAEADGSGCRPTAFVFHESRCGSTLAANMLAVAKHSLVYSEPSIEHSLFDLRRNGAISDAQLVHGLRVLAAAQGRLIWGHQQSGGQPVPRADPSWSPRFLVVKQRSAVTPLIAAFRAAFPALPWAFIHRDATEVLASLMRNAVLLPASPDGSLPPRADTSSREVRSAPCMRDRGAAHVSPFTLALLDRRSGRDTADVATEDYCAASVAELCATALVQAGEARREGLERLASSALPEGAAGALRVLAGRPLDGPAVWDAVSSAPALGGLLRAQDGLLLSGSSGRGVVGGVGQAVFVDYHRGAAPAPADADALPRALLRVFGRHFAPVAGGVNSTAGAGGGWLSDGDLAAMAAESKRYSKSRGNAANAGKTQEETRGRGMRPGGLPPYAGVDSTGLFIGDSEGKQARAWPALRAAGAKYITPLQERMLTFNAAPGAAGDVGTAVAPAGAATAASAAPPRSLEAALAATGGAYTGGGVPDPDFDVRLLPLGAGYPVLYPLGDILRDWNPDIATLPAHYGKYSSLRTLDFSLPGDAAEAEHYRAAELPFVVRNVPGHQPALRTWSDDAYLSRVTQGAADYPVEVNDNAHFMYSNKGRGGRKRAGQAPPLAPGSGDRADPNWVPFAAPGEAHLSMADWVAKAHDAAAGILGEERAPGALPAGWAAPPALQAPRTGVNNMTEEGEAAPAGPGPGGLERGGQGRLRRGARGQAGEGGAPGSALLPQMPQLLLGADGKPAVPYLYGHTLRERLAARAQGGAAATAAAAATIVPASSVLRNRTKRSLYYLRASAGAKGLKDDTWIPGDLPLFARESPMSKFFLVDPPQQRGIHCRFGMPNIIAEDHFDAGRNFIAMIRGRKRYILSPPSECPRLDMLLTGPSARHSASDWTSPEGIAKIGSARSLEVVLEAGEVLYMPAFWFHFIVSMTVNVQCNTRSGSPPHGLEDIRACGMESRATEERGRFTSLHPPEHHQLAAAAWAVAGGAAGGGPARFNASAASVIPAEWQLAIMEALRRGQAGGVTRPGSGAPAGPKAPAPAAGAPAAPVAPLLLPGPGARVPGGPIVIKGPGYTDTIVYSGGAGAAARGAGVSPGATMLGYVALLPFLVAGTVIAVFVMGRSAARWRRGRLGGGGGDIGSGSNAPSPVNGSVGGGAGGKGRQWAASGGGGTGRLPPLPSLT